MHALSGEIIMRLDIQVTVQIARGESICSPRLQFKLANILLLCREPANGKRGKPPRRIDFFIDTPRIFLDLYMLLQRGKNKPKNFQGNYWKPATSKLFYFFWMPQFIIGLVTKGCF